MAKRNRATLKKFFRQGALPSEEHFHDLIDSTLNMADEGFDKSPAKGLEISSLGDYGQLISFCRNDQSLWEISHGEARGNKAKLVFRGTENERPTLALTPDGKLGVNEEDPEWQCDIRGVIRSDGRIGVVPTKHKTVRADGQWHNITEGLAGCHAFEVMAGVGKRRTGRYALVHAVALNTFNPGGFWFNFLNFKKRIRCQQAYYRSWRDKLKLRWFTDKGKYYLQLRSNSDYEGDVRIRYYLTRLWFDEDMSGSLPQSDSEAGT